MGIEDRYDPEDIEKLMIEKPYTELLDEERAFVLKHVANELEYEQIRSTMFAIKGNIGDEGSIAPRPDMRRELIAAFKEERKKSFQYWLNGIGALFLPKQGHAFWTPIARLATIALLVGGVWIGYQQWRSITDQQQVAELKQETLKDHKTSNEVENAIGNNSGLLDQESNQELTPASDIAVSEVDELSKTPSAELEVLELMEDESELDPVDEATGAVFSNIDISIVEDAEAEEFSDEVFTKDVAEDSHNDFRSNNKDVRYNDAVVAEPTAIQPAPAAEIRQVETVVKAHSASKEQLTSVKSLDAKREKRAMKNSRSLAQDPQVIGLLTQAY